MGRSDFEKALKFIAPIEGFISTDPNDKGGLTIFGISSRSHPEAVLEMKELIDKGKKDEAYGIAREIYHTHYWLRTGCNAYPFPFNIVIFDTAVNCGVDTATKLMLKYKDWRDYILLRLEYHTQCETASEHMWGWSRRLVALYNYVKKEGGEE